MQLRAAMLLLLLLSCRVEHTAPFAAQTCGLEQHAGDDVCRKRRWRSDAPDDEESATSTSAAIPTASSRGPVRAPASGGLRSFQRSPSFPISWSLDYGILRRARESGARARVSVTICGLSRATVIAPEIIVPSAVGEGMVPEPSRCSSAWNHSRSCSQGANVAARTARTAILLLPKFVPRPPSKAWPASRRGSNAVLLRTLRGALMERVAEHLADREYSRRSASRAAASWPPPSSWTRWPAWFASAGTRSSRAPGILYLGNHSGRQLWSRRNAEFDLRIRRIAGSPALHPASGFAA